MSSSDTNRTRMGGSWTAIRLLTAFVLLLGAAFAARAENCSDYPNGVLDGAAGTPAPTQLQIDRDCTIRNYTQSNPFDSNINFYSEPNDPTVRRYLIVFDNVYYTGQMSCNDNDNHNHRIWFTNGTIATNLQPQCRDLFIPVEKIDKQTPDGQTTATIGVPFTYTLTMPVLWDPLTGVVIDDSGSLDDLHGTTITDDLNATGVDLTFLGYEAYWRDSGAPVSHTFSNVGGVLTWDNFPIIPAGEQIIIEVTVVLDDSPANVVGTQFVNTARWDFGRLIDGVFYEPLPGESGISPPLTIAAPQLVVTKTGPATMGSTINLGEWGEFAIDVLNSGLTDAWNVTLLDELPNGPTGGMCDLTPEILSAQVYAADGVTPVPGKGPLTPGTDFTVTYSDAPACELSLVMLTPAGVIGPNERLIVRYRTKLDADTDNGITLTNVAGAVQWFNDAGSNADRVAYTRTLTDGTPGVLDHQDAHTVAVLISGYFFEKTVANLSTGQNPATVAGPGDRLRYTLRLQTTSDPINDFEILDELDALNAPAAFAPGTLDIVGALPAGAVDNSSATGGANGTGLIDIGNLSLPAGSELLIRFDVVLSATVADGAIVANQAEVRANGAPLALSDDPNVNGQADPFVAGDEDPTQVLIQVPVPPISALVKANTQATASIGEVFTYRITVPSQPYSLPLYDVRILDDLGASAADLRFVSVTKISGSQPWTPVNTGTATSLVIEDPAIGIDIPAGEQVVVEIAVVLENTPTNVIGLQFTNTANYIYDRVNGDTTTQRDGLPGTTEPMTIVGPDALTMDKRGPLQMSLGVPATFTLDVHNPSTGTAWGLTITDVLPDTATGGMCDAAPSQVTAQMFQADGVTAVSPPLVAGTDFNVTFTGSPDCTLRLTMLTEAAALAAGNHLIVTYQAQLDAGSASNATLTNVAGATEWFSADPSDPGAAGQTVTFTRTLTDGTVGVLDHEDALTVNVPALRFEKTVANVTTGANPATEASPGHRLRYTLLVENLSDVEITGFTLRDELDSLNAPAAFAPGTLTVVAAPAGADTSNTDPNGGASGTGVLDVRNLTLAASGGTVTVVFEVTLAPVIANGTVVLNQSLLDADGVTFALSDDPNVNGAADPNVQGDEDPTRIIIVSAPAFRVQKISTDLTGDPNILLAGETLRYTITVKNIGTADAVDVVLRDQVPVNTTYVAGSTTLNGTPVADVGGLSPLVNGMLINSPSDPTPGTMPADATDDPSNVATITFDVVIDPSAVDGTVISNQGFVSAVTGGVTDQPSDDPATPIADDPTRDIVGNLPLLYAEKSVVLFGDQGSPGVVDPGDVLRYTITVQNSGTIPATQVVLQDAVPANTTYVADSTYLNGLPVAQPDGGTSPLAAGIDVSSSDLTPPLPGPAAGTLSPGGSAVLQFDLRVNDGVPAGTVISNQAVVETEELPGLLTDGDGNPATGPEPTVVVVGAGQLLGITKQVGVVGGGPAVPGAELEYVVTVTNVASVPAYNVVITDDLDAVQPGLLTYVDPSATMNGSAAGVTFVGTTITADYSTLNGALQPGATVVLRFRARIADGLPIGTRITNTAVVAWDSPTQTASASISIDVGGVPGTGILNGAAWHDADFDDTLDTGERLLEGWSVDLYRDGQLVYSGLTDAAGAYRISGVAPNDLTGEAFELRFRAPGAGAATAALGLAASEFTNGLQRISDIVVPSGSNLQNLDLPIDPNGVVYDAMTRAPVAGAVLTLLDAGSGTAVPASCFDDPVQQGQVTLADGYYKFDVNFSDPGCPSGGAYLIGVTAPGSGYVAGYSQMIPPVSGPATAPFAVPSCPGSATDAIPGTTLYCEAQTSEFAPGAAVPARSAGTNHHVHLTLDGSRSPGTSQLFNNHLPLDPDLAGALAITKTTPLLNVSRGQLVPYVVTVSNVSGLALQDVTIVDRYPAGFTYVQGSALLDGVPVEPTAGGLELSWTGVSIAASGQSTLKMLLAVGGGVTEGEYVNRAQAVNGITGTALTGEATATVRVVPDPTFDCTDVTGKVYDDANRNRLQDGGERGLAGVRVVTARGLAATTDAHGRFHITCAVTPVEGRGSNFVLKLDDRTLPSGFRPSTPQVLVQRATRGKALKFNFGASIHRVISLDVADAVFEPGTTEMRVQWRPRLDLLLDELRKAPAVLRLSYLADIEDAGLVERRMQALRQQITESWEALNCCYQLTIEPEVFWRLGAPPEQPVAREPSSR